MNLPPLSPHPVPIGSPRPPAGGVFTESSALQGFSDAHRNNALLLDDQTGGGEAAVVDLAITFGLIGAEFLGAVVEFLEIHRSTMNSRAAGQSDLAAATVGAGAAYCDCDCASAERELAL